MSKENLTDEAAQKKLRELVDNISTAMMVTKLDETPLHAIPMTTKKMDEKGDIWFLSHKDSEHNAHIKKDQRCQLLYADVKAMEFLSLFGDAHIVTEKAVIEELYSSIDNNWFDGVDDPNITCICVTPKSAQYWDTKSNALVSLLKMGYTAATGDKTDIGVTGSLDI
ncbi:pyridoxamine 5'-phosphate oxidase family protein [Gangjinia marincola]|uniref:Pyridoxamine 5'-phosphate oxidase family protein n=1 Tax=Gangjinia marincola TaxID=578463 RepID=A0ABN1MG48_9FLAO